MMLSNSNAIEDSCPVIGYPIDHSLRLRASGGAYASRTPGSQGSLTAWTWAGWVKRGSLGLPICPLFVNTLSWATANFVNYTMLYLDASDKLVLNQNGASGTPEGGGYTSEALRDTTAWFHVTAVWDTDNVAAADRLRLYVNGVRSSVTPYATAAAGLQSFINRSGYVHYTGVYPANVNYYFDGYLSHVHFIDGQALDPSYFGQLNSDGVWVPKAYTGTYGTNGFKLDFSNGTSLTTLGYDSSGNGNNWTLNNVSLTAGLAYDWMVDTPTNNYPTLNPLDGFSTTFRFGNYYAANMSWQAQYASDPPQGAVASTPWPTSGSHYVEVTVDAISLDGTWGYLGIDGEMNVSRYERQVAGTGQISGSVATVTATQFVAGSVVMLACDGATGKLWYGLNGTWLTVSGTPDPAAGTGWAHILNATRLIGLHGRYGSAYNGASINFGQRPFAYTPPTGFKALCTANRGAGSVTTGGTFQGNLSDDGPVVWLNGNPETMTINGNAVTWGTHADKLAGGFKVRTSSASYNASGPNPYSVTVTGKLFGDIAHAPNTAKGTP